MPSASPLSPDLSKKAHFMVEADPAAAAIIHEVAGAKAPLNRWSSHAHDCFAQQRSEPARRIGPALRCHDDDSVHPHRHRRPGGGPGEPAGPDRPAVGRSEQRAANALHLGRPKLSFSVADGATKNAESARDEAATGVDRHGLSDHITMEDRGMRSVTQS